MPIRTILDRIRLRRTTGLLTGIAIRTNPGRMRYESASRPVPRIVMMGEH